MLADFVKIYPHSTTSYDREGSEVAIADSQPVLINRSEISSAQIIQPRRATRTGIIDGDTVQLHYVQLAITSACGAINIYEYFCRTHEEALAKAQQDLDTIERGQV